MFFVKASATLGRLLQTGSVACHRSYFALSLGRPRDPRKPPALPLTLVAPLGDKVGWNGAPTLPVFPQLTVGVVGDGPVVGAHDYYI